MKTLEKSKPLYHGQHVTREEYLDLPEDGFKYDMIEGVLYMTPSPLYEHGKIQGKFIQLLNNFLDKKLIAEVVSEIDVLLPDGGDVLRPDISLILNENLSIVKKHIHGAPDLIVEILSESSKQRDLGVKADRYLACGVKEYFIVDPEEKSLQLWLNQKEKWQKNQGEEIKSILLDGFIVKHSDFWK